jgi:transmembrane protein
MMLIRLVELIYKLVRCRWAYYIGQILVTLPFWQAGLSKLFNFNHTVTYMADNDLHPAFWVTILVIIVEILSPIIIVFGRRLAWLGNGALFVFTLLTMFMFHNFWSYTGEAYLSQLNDFYRHLHMIGGVMMSAIAAELRYGLYQINQKPHLS